MRDPTQYVDERSAVTDAIHKALEWNGFVIRDGTYAGQLADLAIAALDKFRGAPPLSVPPTGDPLLLAARAVLRAADEYSDGGPFLRSCAEAWALDAALAQLRAAIGVPAGPPPATAMRVLPRSPAIELARLLKESDDREYVGNELQMNPKTGLLENSETFYRESAEWLLSHGVAVWMATETGSFLGDISTERNLAVDAARAFVAGGISFDDRPEKQGPLIRKLWTHLKALVPSAAQDTPQ